MADQNVEDFPVIALDPDHHVLVTKAATTPIEGRVAVSEITGLRGTSTVTLPPGLRVVETVAAVGITTSHHILAALAPHDDADENDPEMLSLMALSARPGTDEITFTAGFSSIESGPVKINWSAF